MFAKLQLLLILIKIKIITLFKKSLKVRFKKICGAWYCDIPGWPKKYFSNTLMVGEAAQLIDKCAWYDADSIEFCVKFGGNEDFPDYYKLMKESSSISRGAYYYLSDKLSNIWLCPVTLFVLGQYPENIYFKPVYTVEKIDGEYAAWPKGYNGVVVDFSETEDGALQLASLATDELLF